MINVAMVDMSSICIQNSIRSVRSSDSIHDRAVIDFALHADYVVETDSRLDVLKDFRGAKVSRENPLVGFRYH